MGEDDASSGGGGGGGGVGSLPDGDFGEDDDAICVVGCVDVDVDVEAILKRCRANKLFSCNRPVYCPVSYQHPLPRVRVCA